MDSPCRSLEAETRPADSEIASFSLLDRHILTAMTLGILLRLWGLAGFEFWADEIHTQLISEVSIHKIVSPVFMSPYTPLYFLLTKISTLIIGRTEWLRLWPVLFGVALIPIMAWVARISFNRSVARMTAWLIACSPLLIYFSREHRFYSLYLLLTALMLLTALRYRSHPSVRSAIFFSITAALAFLTFPFAMFFGIGLLPWFIGIGSKKNQILSFSIFGCVAVVWMSIAFTSVAQEGQNYYGMLNMRLLINAWKTYIVGNFSMRHVDLALIARALIGITFVTALIGLVSLRRSGRTLAGWLGFGLLPLLAIYLLQFRWGAIYNYKSFIPTALFALTITAVGLNALPLNIRNGFLFLILLCNLYTDRLLLDRAHAYNWNTPRTASFVAQKHMVEADLTSRVTALRVKDHVLILDILYFGAPGNRPILVDEESFLKAYAATHRSTMLHLLNLHGKRVRMEDLTDESGLLDLDEKLRD